MVTLGLDQGKNRIHTVGLDDDGRIVLRRRVGRDRLLAQTGNMVSCLIGMEACGGDRAPRRRTKRGQRWEKVGNSWQQL
jgi:hypothetical protein